ncbi:hypothetical protein J6590_008988 [Homalodisca vitripennis]|nr:hypothetical protein J6590_008988 [Homalodisca vitripennis]
MARWSNVHLSDAAVGLEVAGSIPVPDIRDLLWSGVHLRELFVRGKLEAHCAPPITVIMEGMAHCFVMIRGSLRSSNYSHHGRDGSLLCDDQRLTALLQLQSSWKGWLIAL